MDKKDLLFFIFIILFSVFFVFIGLKEHAVGRFELIPIIHEDIFTEGWLSGLNNNYRTYSSIVYSILEEGFLINITPITILILNKVISVFLLIIVFLIAKTVFKKRWLALLVLISFVSSQYIQENLSSFEHGIIALFFVHISILFLLKFIKNKELTAFILSNITLVLSALFRYELCFLFGLPYIVYYCVVVRKFKNTRKYMIITTIFLIIILTSFVNHFIFKNDNVLLGVSDSKWELNELLKNSVNIIDHNIIINKDLFLREGYISIFSYSSFIISLILIIILIISIVKGKQINSKNEWIYIFVFFSIFYFIFQLGFHMEGLRSGWKYSMNYFLSEIIITYFAISWLVKKIFYKLSKGIIYPITIVLIISFLMIAYISSDSISFDITPNVEPYFDDMIILQRNVNLNNSCKIIEVTGSQPLLDLYFSIQGNSLDMGSPPHFYENIKNLKKNGRCFYYYDEKYLTENDYLYGEKFEIDFEKLEQSFILCDKTIVFDSPRFDRPYTLIRYDC